MPATSPRNGLGTLIMNSANNAPASDINTRLKRATVFVVASHAPVNQIYLEALLESLAPDFSLIVLPFVATERWKTIEAEARQALDVVLNASSNGPYYLLGMERNGILTYEIASLLCGLDAHVEFVGIVDRELFSESESSKATDLNREVRRCVDLSSEHCFRCRQYHPLTLAFPVNMFRPHDVISPTVRASPSNSLLPSPVVSLIPDTFARGGAQIEFEAIKNALNSACGTATFNPPLAFDDSPAVIIQKGHPKATPLIYIPGAGASSTSIIDVLRCLGGETPVFGLEPRGLDNISIPHSTVSAIANSYLRAIDSVHGFGPIHLLGHSFGGQIAFELATRLAPSDRVRSLVLLDSSPPQQDHVAPDVTNVEVIKLWMETIELLVGHTLSVDQTAIEGLRFTEIISMMHRILIDEGLMPRRSSADALAGPINCFARALRMAHTPSESYVKPVYLITASDPLPGKKTDLIDIENWRSLAPNMVTDKTPGNHLTMLKGANAAVLARSIKRILDQTITAPSHE